MEIRQLRYLIAISEVQNVNRAAKLCFVTQPALTQQIKKLEDEFNTSLLIRRGRGIVLSEDGKRLTRYAKKLMKNVDAIKDEFSVKNKSSNQVYLGVTFEVSNFMNFNKLPKLSDLKVNVKKMSDEQMSYELNRGLINAGISHNKLTLDGINSKPIAKEKMYLVSSYKHILNGKKIDVNMLAAEPVALLKIHDLNKSCLIRFGINPIITVETLDELKRIIKNSNFISILPYSLVVDIDKHEICVAEIKNESFSRNVYLICNEYVRNNCADYFNSCFQNSFH
jgi:LysR family hydrogen peroxide-inducible transcriptional activator